MAEICFFNTDQLVWLDESGCDKRDYRTTGYGLVYHRILHRGQRVSALAAMCSEGVIALELQEGTYNGDKFMEFLTCTYDTTNVFDGSSPRSVLVMDNCGIHHVSPSTKNAL
jgi:hypothetical protein